MFKLLNSFVLLFSLLVLGCITEEVGNGSEDESGFLDYSEDKGKGDSKDSGGSGELPGDSGSNKDEGENSPNDTDFASQSDENSKDNNQSNSDDEDASDDSVDPEPDDGDDGQSGSENNHDGENEQSPDQGGSGNGSEPDEESTSDSEQSSDSNGSNNDDEEKPDSDAGESVIFFEDFESDSAPADWYLGSSYQSCSIAWEIGYTDVDFGNDTKVLATGLKKEYCNDLDLMAKSPKIKLPENGNIEMRFRVFLRGEEVNPGKIPPDYLYIEVVSSSLDKILNPKETASEGFVHKEKYIGGISSEYVDISADLNEFKGNTITVRFFLSADGTKVSDGFFIDDLGIYKIN